MAWIQLDENGKFTNPHTGVSLRTPKPGVILRAIQGLAGDEPPKGLFLCLDGNKFIGVTPQTWQSEHERVLDAKELYIRGRAVVNNGGAWFTEAGTFEF